VSGRKAGLVGRLEKHDDEAGGEDAEEDEEEDDAEDEEEESDEEADSSAADDPIRHYCGAKHTRGRCQRLVKTASLRCNWHQASQKPGRAPKRSARKRTRPSRSDPSPGHKRLSLSPTRHPPERTPASRTLCDLEHLKKLMELTTSVTNRSAAEPTPVTGHDVHKMHMDMINAVGWMGGAREGTAQGMAMRASGMPHEDASVTSVLERLSPQQYEEKFREMGVAEVDDLCAIQDS
jgi:hypothetical protein